MMCQQYGRTALNRAAHIGHLEVVRLLLDRGANVNTAAMVRHIPSLKYRKRMNVSMGRHITSHEK